MRPAARLRRRVTLAAATLGAWIVLGATAFAAFAAIVTAHGEFSTAVLEPPTLLSATGGTCQADQHDSIVLSWTASTSSWAEGYEVLRSTDGATYTLIATLAGVQTDTYTDSPLAFSTTYYYRVRTIKTEWTSQPAEVSHTTRGSQCLV
ncbi:MAG: fibronectin type III domain-containing protein [Actinobacteria bacterium]|nr:fibronectin type III domain-containing protein [Actinomycetota bacterium]